MSFLRTAETAEMEIRRATASDIDQLARLRAKLLAEMGQCDASHDTKELANAARFYFRKSIPSGAFAAFVAVDDEKIVGMSGIVIHNNPPVFGNPEGREAYIMNMYTLPAYRRKGIATRLFEASLGFIKRKRINTVWLRASPFGKPLYRKYGFRENPNYQYMELMLK